MITITPAGSKPNRTEREASAALSSLPGVAVVDIRVGGGGPGKQVRQVDILLITPTGVAVVEVKGTAASGILTAPVNGGWTVGDDPNPFHGRSERTQNPAAQADTGAKVLKTTLREAGIDLGFITSAVAISGDVTVPGGSLWNGGTLVARTADLARLWPTAHRPGRVDPRQVHAALHLLVGDQAPTLDDLHAEGFGEAGAARTPQRHAAASALTDNDVAARWAEMVADLTALPSPSQAPTFGPHQISTPTTPASPVLLGSLATAPSTARPWWKTVLWAPGAATQRRAFFLVWVLAGLLITVSGGLSASSLLFLAAWVPIALVASVVMSIGGMLRRAVTLGAVLWPEVLAAYALPFWAAVAWQGRRPVEQVTDFLGILLVGWPLAAAAVFWPSLALLSLGRWARRKHAARRAATACEGV